MELKNAKKVLAPDGQRLLRYVFRFSNDDGSARTVEVFPKELGDQADESEAYRLALSRAQERAGEEGTAAVLFQKLDVTKFEAAGPTEEVA